MKNKFAHWYALKIAEDLEKGINIDDIEVSVLTLLACKMDH